MRTWRAAAEFNIYQKTEKKNAFFVFQSHCCEKELSKSLRYEQIHFGSFNSNFVVMDKVLKFQIRESLSPCPPNYCFRVQTLVRSKMNPNFLCLPFYEIPNCY